MQTNNLKTIILTAIITALVVIGGIYLWQSFTQSPETIEIETVEIEENELESEEAIIQENGTEANTSNSNLLNEAIVGTTIEQDYQFTPGQRTGITSISNGNILYIEDNAINEINLSEEIISSFYNPVLPNNSNIIFISTHGNSESERWDDQPKRNKIYSYNLETGDLNLIYEEQEFHILRTMGIEGSKLILMVDRIDNSPGPCFAIWADWNDFKYLELSDINAGLQNYTVPSYQIEIAKEEQTECYTEMGI